MYKFQLTIFLALIVVVFGNQNVDRVNCDRLTPIIVAPQEAAGEWYGIEMYRNIGVGRKLVEEETVCLVANLTALSSTRYGIKMDSINGLPDFDSDRSVIADLLPSGRVKYQGDKEEENIIVAERNKKYVTVAFCSSEPGHEGSFLNMLVTYRFAGQPELSQRKLNAMREAIKANLGIDRLDAGPLYCRTHGKN